MPKVLAVDDDEVNLKVVAASLRRMESGAVSPSGAVAPIEVFTARSGTEALQKVDEIHPDLVILDVMMPDINGFEVCQKLRANPDSARVLIMMLTALNTVEEKLKGFEAGADDYLPKPFAPDELQARVKVLLRRIQKHEAPQVQQNCKTLAMFSLRGGVGVSSLAVNLAVSLMQIWGKPTVLVDLALTAGQCALMLNLPYRRTWADLAKIPVDDIETEVIRQVLLQHPCGLQVLAAPFRPEEAEELDGPKINKVFSLLKEQFSYIVIDLPHDFRDTSLAGLDEADAILAIFTPELASVRSMSCALSVFEKLNYPTEKIYPVQNWTFPKGGLVRKDIESAVGRPTNLVIPYSPEPMVNAINMGTPPVLNDPESPLSTLLEDLAYFFSEESQKKKRPPIPSAAWQRVAKRLQKRLQTARLQS